jgi:RHS repeat-associated protein
MDACDRNSTSLYRTAVLFARGVRWANSPSGKVFQLESAFREPSHAGDRDADLRGFSGRDFYRLLWVSRSSDFLAVWNALGSVDRSRVKVPRQCAYSEIEKLIAENREKIQSQCRVENCNRTCEWVRTSRTDSNGGKICDSRFYPYGEEFTAPCAGDPYKFTGKERDSETGLDYFGARYYGNHYGRFTSVDPALESGRQEDPQRWNRYAYTRNNPLIYVDPDGKDFVDFLIGVSNGLSSSIALNLNRIDAQSKNRDFQAGQVVGDALAAATGALVMYAGAGGVGGGAALSVSGAGAVAGVPAIIASAGLLASGATTVTIGSSNAILGGANLFFSTPGSYAPDRQLPRDPASGRPIPESENPHTQLGQRTSRHRGETYTQGREFGTGGRHIRDVDFTNHGRRDHPNPHQHRIDPKTGRRLEPEPLGKN